MNIAIVDDDKIEISRFRYILNNFLSEKSIRADITEYYSGEEFISCSDIIKYEIVFMDIYMEGINGIEASKILKEKSRNSLLIFFTSSQEYMTDAFSCHAFEYIIKPASQERIFKVMNEALKYLPEVTKCIRFESSRETVSIPCSEFYYAQTDGHYLIIKCNEKSYRTRLPFSEFINKTAAFENIIAINKGIAVNMDQVSSIDKNSCILKNHISLPVKVRDSLKIQQKWHEYKISKG